MKKIFKLIYYPVLIVLAAVFMALGFASVSFKQKDSTLTQAAQQRATGYYNSLTGITAAADIEAYNESIATKIYSELSKYYTVDGESVRYFRTIGSSAFEPNPDNNNLNDRAVYATATEDGVSTVKPTVVYQNATVLDSTLRKMPSLDNGQVYVDKQIKNVIVAIPGTKTIAAKKAGTEAYGDAVMFTAGFDGNLTGARAAQLAAVSNLMNTAIEVVKSGTAYENDLLFVFSDASQDNALGSYTFKHQFAGFDNIYTRVKLGVSFNADGIDGPVKMTHAGAYVFDMPPDDAGNKSVRDAKADADVKNSGVIALANKIGGTSGAPSGVASRLSCPADYASFDGIPAINYGSLYDAKAGTHVDTTKNVSTSLINGFATVMQNAVKTLGSYNLSDFNAGAESGFYSYFGSKAISYPKGLSIALGCVILVMLAVALFMIVYKKSYSLKNVLVGALTALLVALATLAAMYLIVLLLMLILGGFEVISLHALALVVFTNPGLLIFVLAAAATVAVAFTIILKRIFLVKAMDVVRGSTLVFGLFAAVFAFAMPAVSYLFTYLALGQAAVLLVSLFLKDKFRAFAHFDIERLFLYTVPLIFTLPILCAELLTLTALTPLIMLPLYAGLFVLMANGILPYVDYLKAAVSKAYAHLPARTYRSKQKVVERIEDPVKKGKFTEREVEQVVKTKVAREYAHPVGITAALLLIFVGLILCSSLGHKPGVARSTAYGYLDSAYKDALVLVNDNNVKTLEIYDLDAYKYYGAVLDGFKWNTEKRAYVKSVSVSSSASPSVTAADGGKAFNITPAENGGYYTVTVSNFEAGTIESVSIKTTAREAYEVTLIDPELTELVFRLPVDSNNIRFEFEGSNLSTVDVAVEQIATEKTGLWDVSEWSKFNAEYKDHFKTFKDVDDINDAFSLTYVYRYGATGISIA